MARHQSDDGIIAQALTILAKRLKQTQGTFDSPDAVKHYCMLHLGALDHEVFGVLFLDVQNRLIKYESMFRGTLTQTSVYPREVVKACLALDAASVILTHNHPSGAVTPSRADECLTSTLKTALALIDVRVLDHVVVSASESLSMAERGLL
jgi:DNA repair protein RadC